MNRIVLLVLAFLMAGCASDPTKRSAKNSEPPELPVRRRADLNTAINDGVAFLVKAQQPDGSWGTGLVTRGTEIYSMVPGSHDAYRVATTALCVMALREAGETDAHARGVKYLINHGYARRDDGAILYNIWAHIYALQALAAETRFDDDVKLAAAAKDQLDQTIRYATYSGGWNYYDFSAQTSPPSLGATSFGTAAGLVALWEARLSGMEIPQRLVDLSMNRLRDARLPNGLFTYGADYKYIPRMPGNMERGAVGRTQPSNYALWLWGDERTDETVIVNSLQMLIDNHQFLEMGRKRPFPHEAWYQTSGYYYYFDHYYAARMLEKLNPTNQARYAPAIAEMIMPHQEADGSWWDYAMWDYHKPYGTAFAVMTLLRCRSLQG